MSTYPFSIQTDFGGQFNQDQFHREILDDSNITTTLTRIDVDDQLVDIVFDSALSTGEETALNDLVENYTYLTNPTVNLVTDGSWGSTATIKVTQTENRTITLPDASDTIIGQNTTDTITNKTMYVSSNNMTQTYDVIVDINGSADFTSISAAFNAGYTSVFVRNGTYVEMADINIPDRGKIVGEANGKVVVYFIGPYSVKADGSGGTKEMTGTFNITNGSNAVVGTGTLFTNLSVGEFVMIGNNTYTIASITDDTNLTITDTFQGKSLTNIPFIAQAMYTGINISNLIILNSASTGLYLRAIRHSTISYVAVDSCSPPIQLIDSIDVKLDTLIASNGTGIGLTVDFCLDTMITTTNIYNNDSHGIMFTSDCHCIILEGCSVTCNNGIGLYFSGNSDCITCNDCISKQNNSDGIRMGVNSNNIICENVSTDNNNGHGINALSDTHTLASCIARNNSNCGMCIKSNTSAAGSICTGNSVHGISIESSENTSVYGNICFSNTKNGINSTSDNVIISNNICHSNTEHGIELTVDSNNNIVTGNQIRNNTLTNFVDSGTGNVSANNITT